MLLVWICINLKLHIFNESIPVQMIYHLKFKKIADWGCYTDVPPSSVCFYQLLMERLQFYELDAYVTHSVTWDNKRGETKLMHQLWKVVSLASKSYIPSEAKWVCRTSQIWVSVEHITDYTIHRWDKNWTCFAKQQPGRTSHNILAN